MLTYESKEARLSLARKLASEGIVLLKNDNALLPIKSGAPIAIFGRAQLDTLIGGSGSGATASDETTLITEEFIKAGLTLDPALEGFYKNALDTERKNAPDPEEERNKFKELLNSGLIYEIFGKYKAPIEEFSINKEILTSIPSTHTAFFILGRASGGEECDRRVQDDYYLTASEKDLLHRITAHFENVVVVLNVNGFVDLSLIQSYPSVRSIVFLGTAGEQGAAALADIITGKAVPCGKLPSTIAYSYEAYPSSDLFFTDKDRPDTILTYEDFGLSAKDNRNPKVKSQENFAKRPVAVYKEGIYMGYRYFDTFNVPVMYPFGYGLSYADFHIAYSYACREGQNLQIVVNVTNVSTLYSGKEVVQLYVSAPSERLEKPYQELLTYAKTKELAPDETEELTLSFPLKELASYDEASASYIIENGEYFLRLGNSSRNTKIIGKLQAEETIVTASYSNRLSLSSSNKGKLAFLSNKGVASYSYSAEEIEKQNATCLLTLLQKDFNESKNSTSAASCSSSLSDKEARNPVSMQAFTLKDVKDGHCTLEELVEKMTPEELAVLLNGYGPGLPFGGMGGKYASTIQYSDGTDIAVSTHPTGFAGYISPALTKYGIPSVFYKDGPAGVQLTAWPTGISMACTFNMDLLKEFGIACATEASGLGVDSWLAPGINLQRNPIGGRNFEYYSEDPRHTGYCGLAITLGAEEIGITTCPKHFALNEQETYRRGSTKNSFDALDSIVEERTARELYLKPFEMVVKNSKVSTLMTSFNKINGIFAAGNLDLCEGILREEWGYEGIVVTDWGDMDIVVDGADAIAAGNDVIMPGGPPVIEQVLTGFQEGRVTLSELRKSALRFLTYVMTSNSCKKYWEEQ